MTTELLEARVAQLENRVREVEKSVYENAHDSHLPPSPRGWRAFVGVDANNPDYKDAERFGREWRFADSPNDEPEAQ